MSSLLLAHLPDEVYEGLTSRAERAGRSLAEQAVEDLREKSAFDSRARRRSLIEELRQKHQEEGPIAVGTPPEQLIREDREA